MHRKLEQLKALLRHQVPDGDLAIILERAADLLLAKTRKQRFAQTTRAHASNAGPSEVQEPEVGANMAPASAAHPRDATPSKVRAARKRAAELDANDACAAELDLNDVRESTAHARDATAGKARANDVAALRPEHARSRYIPRSVVREVFARDEAQCTFVSADGRRCPERGFLELHHDMPYAQGGPATTANLRTVCRAHNALYAEQDFGRAFIHSSLRRARMRKRDRASELVSRRAHRHGTD